MAVKHFLFIRHGKTRGNIQRRYIGNIEEPLCGEGIQELKLLASKNILPPVSTLFCGPALRCRQTAEILFPNTNYTLCPLKEIDFGIFKNKNAQELTGCEAYEKWLETNCMGDIPGGESVSDFKRHCCETFAIIASSGGDGTTALVIHGGNIMAILEKYCVPKQDFYAYHIPDGGFLLCRYENGSLQIVKTSL
ncbi:MAG: histidine phosphatase family protein [Clostridiales bacterium]|jgi:alpha-ribazole phosphatase|nr:histidine phosphatase family protein [Clostridiales bacterium]